MLTFRPKLGSERSKEWRCCFCFHVRTFTIIFGTWHLMMHLVALSFMAAVVRDPRLLDELESEPSGIGGWREMGAPMPTPLSNVEAPPNSNPARISQKDHYLLYRYVDVSALVTVCTLTITLMLIYGASRGKPVHLLPFFCLQIFDFAITMLTAMGYLCYVRSIHRLVAEARRVPWREELLELPPPALALIVLSSFLLAVLVKGYLVNVVWRCYKYLSMRTHAMHNLTPFVISDERLAGLAHPYTTTAAAVPSPAPGYASLLPNYEEATKQSPPPSYRVATLLVTDDSENASRGPAPPAPAATVVMLPGPGTQARV